MQDMLQPLETLLAADNITLIVHVEQHYIGMNQVVELVDLLRSGRHTDVLNQRLQQ